MAYGDKKKQTFKVQVPLDVKLYDIACLLTSAFEGGSNYWIESQPFKKIKPTEYRHVLDEGDENPREWPLYDYPLLPGGAVEFQADDGSGKVKTCRLDLDTIQQGLICMATKYPRHFADFMNDNSDATTGDVFVQCCVFGELVYG